MATEGRRTSPAGWASELRNQVARSWVWTLRRRNAKVLADFPGQVVVDFAVSGNRRRFASSPVDEYGMVGLLSAVRNRDRADVERAPAASRTDLDGLANDLATGFSFRY
jgi:hypothetical protein